MYMKSNVDYYWWFIFSKFNLIYFKTLNCDQLLQNCYMISSSKQLQFVKRVNCQIVDVTYKSHLCVNRNFFWLWCSSSYAFAYEAGFSFLVTYWVAEISSLIWQVADSHVLKILQPVISLLVTSSYSKQVINKTY